MSSNLSLQKYFDSSYSILQEEVSLFIKGFPLIKMQEISSLNTLINLLIKQNSMLGGRLRDQIVQIKEGYKKSEAAIAEAKKGHEGRYIELERKYGEMERRCLEVEERKKEVEDKGRRDGEEIKRLKEELREMREEKKRWEEQQKHKPNPQTTFISQQISQTLPLLLDNISSFTISLLQTKPTKSPQSIFSHLHTLTQTLNSISSLISPHPLSISTTPSKKSPFLLHSSTFSNQLKQKIQSKFKLQKSRSKSQKHRFTVLTAAVDSISQAVKQYAKKSNETIRVIKLAERSVDAGRIFMEGFEGEVERLMVKVQGVKEGMTGEEFGVGRRVVDIGAAQEGRKQRQGFEGVLMKVVEALEKKSAAKFGKEDLLQIKDQQTHIKKDIISLQKSCKESLSSFKHHLESSLLQFAQQLKVKQQISDQYERSFIQSRTKEEISRKRAEEVSTTNLELHKSLLEKTNKILSLQSHLTDLQTTINQLQQKIIALQHQNYQIQQQTQSSILSISTPLKQELHRLRQQSQSLIQHHLLEKQELLLSLTTEKHKTQQLMLNLCSSKQQKSHLNEKLALQSSQTLELTKIITFKQKEITSLQELIRELETKIRCQAIELRSNEFQLTAHQTKTSSLEAKIETMKTENSSNLVDLHEIKSSLARSVQLQETLKSTEQKLMELSEENLKLKMLLKETKVELVNSRKMIGGLKEMKEDYEGMRGERGQLERMRVRAEELREEGDRLRGDVERKERRVEELERWQMEAVTLQAENNRLMIEVRHMRNVMGRINEIKEFV